MVRVETNPPGAEVHYDYKPKGTTPAEFEVDWYGKHKITLDHPEYGRRVEYVQLNAPPYLYFPFDFFTALLPFNVTDRQAFSFDLTEPNTNPSENGGRENESEDAQAAGRRR